MVFIVAVNCSEQPLHLWSPARCASPCSLVASTEPQCGQTGPSGQRICSKVSLASSSENLDTSFKVNKIASPHLSRGNLAFSCRFVKCIIPFKYKCGNLLLGSFFHRRWRGGGKTIKS